MKPRIGLITPGTFAIPSPVYSSVETALLQLTPHLAREYDLHIIARQQDGPFATRRSQGVRIQSLPATTKASYLAQVIAWCRTMHYDCLQVENRPLYLAPLKRALPHQPIILSLHSITFLQGKPPVLRQIYNSLQLADAIIVNSEFLRDYLLRRARHHQEHEQWRKKIFVQRLGIDTQRFIPISSPALIQRRQQLKERYGLGERPVLLFCGRIQPLKGVHLLLQAALRLERRGHRFALLLVGGSHYGRNQQTPYVKRVLRLRNQLQEPSFMIPFVPYERIASYYQLADILVMPSIGPEAFGLVNLEGMASALPVISFHRGGIGECVQDKKTGLLLPGKAPVRELVSACAYLFQNPAQGRVWGEAGRRLVEQKFTWEESARRLAPFYRRLLQPSTQKGGRV